MPDWQIQLADSIKCPKTLLDELQLPSELLPELEKAHKLFPIRVTRSYLQKIEKGNRFDPLLLQILPRVEETLASAGYSTNPVQDTAFEKTPGLLHKYTGRVLLTLTGLCAIHCRYCFRRHFDYSSSNPSKKNWEAALSYIANNKSIYEVIFSGGDPLSLPDQKLSRIATEVSAIPHVKFIRIHTRQIVVLPSRVDERLLGWIKGLRKKLIIVLHINHPTEIDQTVASAINKLKEHNIELLNQSVLLKNVNDDVNILTMLSMKLIELGIKPYYLHMLDKTHGAAHFNVSDKSAQFLIKQLRENLPGYAVPNLVREIPHMAFKQPLNDD